MTRHRASTAVLAVTAAAALASPAAAAPLADGRDFGGHVVHCASAAGFDRVHNPGTHRGFAGWSAEHECMH